MNPKDSPTASERADFEAHFKHLCHSTVWSEWTGSKYTHPHVQSLYDGWLARSRLAAATPVVPRSGWKLVPIEPTKEMCIAAVKFANGNAVYKNVAPAALEIEEGIYGETYAAMLAASPSPRTPEQPEQPCDSCKAGPDDHHEAHCRHASVNTVESGGTRPAAVDDGRDTRAPFTLKQLREAADRACDLAMNAGVKGAINWGDLGCTYAEHYDAEEDGSGYRVHIEEAAPGERELIEFVAGKLREQGFGEIDVQTEW